MISELILPTVSCVACRLLLSLLFSSLSAESCSLSLVLGVLAGVAPLGPASGEEDAEPFSSWELNSWSRCSFWDRRFLSSSSFASSMTFLSSCVDSSCKRRSLSSRKLRISSSCAGSEVSVSRSLYSRDLMSPMMPSKFFSFSACTASSSLR